MIQNKLIRAKSSSESTSNFTTYLDPPIVLSSNSSIALQNFSMELTPNVIDITSETQKYSYATIKDITTNAYNQLITEHTFTIPIGAYNQQNLAYNLTTEANKQLFYESSNLHSKEQGSEIKFYYDQPSEKISFYFAGRLATEFCGTPIDKVSQTDTTGNTYSYQLDANNLGEVTRLTNDATEFDFYEYSTIPFCRGSGSCAIDVTASQSSWIIGLIDPLHLLSNPSSNVILARMKYGIMKLDNTSTYDINDFPQDTILLKMGEDDTWDDINEANSDNITFILGKRTSNLGDGYNLFITTDGSSHFPDFEFEYGNYVLICGTYTKDNVIKYKITESKIVTSPSSQKGYYPEINPIYINDTQQSNNFINLENIKTNDDGLGFIPNGPGTYITLNLFNDETAQLYGYQKFINLSSEVFAAVNNIVNIIPNNPINSRYEFPDNFKIIVDVPLDCYDEGKSQNILSFIPNAITSSGFIIYQPSPPLFITLKNTNPIYLDHINFKLYDNNNQLLPNQVSSSAVLIIQSIKQ